ncbi:MAG: hypothetical protein ACHQZR_04110 [Candidatus Limnocylindrales bacterium]
MTARAAGPSPDHAGHDPLLIARSTAGDPLTAAETTALADRLAGCAACRALQTDLLAVSTALRADLPAPHRTRDFRLTPAEVAAHHGPSWLERLTAGLAGPALRPLATALCAIGLLLAVSGAVLPRVGGSASSALSNVGSPVTDTSGERAAEAPAASAAPSAPPPPNAGAGAVDQSLPVPVTAPSPPGADHSAGVPQATAGPAGALGLPKNSGSGDHTAGGIPPGTPVAAGPGGPDIWTLVIIAGGAVFALGVGGLLVARRRPSPLP